MQVEEVVSFSVIRCSVLLMERFILDISIISGPVAATVKKLEPLRYP
jgi:hypothetical protein